MQKVPNLNIAFLCTSTSWGGLELNQVKRATRWHNKRVRVIFICKKGSPAEELANKNGLNCVYIKRLTKKFALRSGVALSKILKSNKIDLVITRDRRELSAIAFAKFWWTGKSMYITAMQFGNSQKDFIHDFRYKSVDYWISLLPYLEEQSKTLTNVKHERIHVIPEGVEPQQIYSKSKDEARKELNLDENKTYIGLIGRLDPLKGQLETIEAYHRAKLEDHGVELILMGESTKEIGTDYENTLVEFKTQFDLPIHFIPFNPDPSTFYGAIDIQVVASHGETFGMVTVEGIVNGCLMVGANSKGTKSLIETYGGLLFQPGDIEDISSKLTEAMGMLSDYSPNKDLTQELQADYNDERYFELIG
jgi:D-inositol-3-phosphate glycosyltransferase